MVMPVFYKVMRFLATQYDVQFGTANRAVGRVAGFARNFHTVADKVGLVVDHQEGVACELLAEGARFRNAVVMADVQGGFVR